jgi:hypothetical protein
MTTVNDQPKAHTGSQVSQPCASASRVAYALFTHQPGADPYVKMQPILDGLAF